MKTVYTPKGVCAQQMVLTLEDNIIKDVAIYGGCDGNLSGISRLLVGMSAEDAITKMKGIICGRKLTSCPDQLALALEQCINVRNM